MKKKSQARIKKEEIVKKLVEKLKKAKSIVLADYHGLNVASLSVVKKELEKDEAEFAVAKNTLLSIAARKAGLQIPEEALSGPTAVVFAQGDPITPIKELARLQKQFEKPAPKLGFLGKEVLSVEKIRQLAILPSKLELQAKVVGALNSPIYGIVSVLNANLRNLVYVLSQIQQSKGGAS